MPADGFPSRYGEPSRHDADARGQLREPIAQPLQDRRREIREHHIGVELSGVEILVQNAGAVFPPETSLEEAMTSLKSGYALIVVENSRPVGILTKIDVLDYVAGKI